MRFRKYLDLKKNLKLNYFEKHLYSKTINQVMDNSF